MTNSDTIKLAFYGDDFTGSTDALDFLSRAGVRTVLFLDNPTPAQMARFDYPEAIGIAGMTRAMEPPKMAATLSQAFNVLKALGPKHVHYKVCSTFDSSPTIGNLGTAIEVGQQVFQNDYTPVLPAAPHLGRYTAFGNLFARMGTVQGGAIHRLDRHPSMRNHPVTPATESDLRLHLAKQTTLSAGLIDLVTLQQPEVEILQSLDKAVASGKKVMFFDTIYNAQLAKIGGLWEAQAKRHTTLFSVGSSGVEKALGDYWQSQGALTQRTKWHTIGPSRPMLVLSGSMSPVTAAQLEWAHHHGFVLVAVEVAALTAEHAAGYIATYHERVLSALRNGQSVILHTAKGPDDARTQQIKSFLATKQWSAAVARTYTARRFGEILGRTASRVLEQFPLKRLVIAGGDTSSHVARILGIEAVEMIAPAYPGAPMCRAYASNAAVDGIEINLKGGQVGDAAYFGTLQQGTINNT